MARQGLRANQWLDLRVRNSSLGVFYHLEQILTELGLWVLQLDR